MLNQHQYFRLIIKYAMQSCNFLQSCNFFRGLPNCGPFLTFYKLNKRKHISQTPFSNTGSLKLHAYL